MSQPSHDFTAPDHRGGVAEYEVLLADTITGEFDSVLFDGTPLSEGVQYVGSGLGTEDGLFRALEISSTAVSMVNYLAIDGDANGDQVVNHLDFNVWNDNKYTSVAAANPVPEPAAVWMLSILLCGAVALIHRRI